MNISNTLDSLAVGIDVGTTGVRAVALDAAGRVAARADSALSHFGPNRRDPAIWWAATESSLAKLLRQVDGARIRAFAVDGTSGTLLAVDADGQPLGNALMYNDVVSSPRAVTAIAEQAPRASAAHGPTSGLLKAIELQDTKGTARLLHQADWITGRLSGRFGVSDENNALKTGYDPILRDWPDWIARTPARRELLPEVVEPGSPIGGIDAGIAKRLGVARDAIVAAGTTDGCASFLATGAQLPGEAVTALGSTLVLKMLSDKPLFAPDYGLYSHRIGNRWLAGGASNSGGAVLAKYFTPERLSELSAKIDPKQATGLRYYPLLQPGERFPVNNPTLQPKLEPRALDDVRFLQAILEGISAIEVRGYDRLKELGAPELRSVRTVGGGAQNAAWTAIRQRALGVPFLSTASQDAAAGTARLALSAADGAGLL